MSWQQPPVTFGFTPMLAPGGAPWVQQKPQQPSQQQLQFQQLQQQQFQQQQLQQQQFQQQQLQQQQLQQQQLQQQQYQLQQQQTALQPQAAAVPTQQALAAAYETVLQAHKAATVDPQYLGYYNSATQVYEAMLKAASAAAAQQQQQQQQQPAVQPQPASNPMAAAAASAAAAVVVKRSAEPGAVAAARVAAPAPVPAPAPQAQAQAQEYPPALKSWAERQLERGKALGVESAVTTGLFGIVQAAAQHGLLWTRNWDAEPDVPALAAAAAAAAPASAAASGAWGAGGRDARAEKRYRASDGLGAPGASASSPARQTWSAPDEEEGGGFSEGSGFLAFSGGGSGGGGGGGRGAGGWQRAGGYFHKNPSRAFREQQQQQQQQHMMQGGPGEQEEGADAVMMWGGRGDRQRKRASREERFSASSASGAGSSSSSSSSSGSLVASAILAAQESGQEVDWSQFAVVGTCASLEKRYFRLLAPPDPSTVRPEPILAAALDALQQRYLEGALTYASVCDSLKAVRQDLAVQHIRNAFTVKVYQVHARLALENGDQGEFNQSQGQLELLWREEGSDRAAYVEFAAYRVLYMAWMGQAGEANAVLKKFSPDALRHPWVRHALAAASAQATENWAHFFRLYRCVGGLRLFAALPGFCLTPHAPFACPPPTPPLLCPGLRPTRAAAS